MVLFFVYGTLTERATAQRLLSAVDYRGRARLSGLRRADGEYPTLVPGDSVTGRLLRTPDVERLDRYEGVEQGLYVRMTVPLAADGEHHAAETYVGNPALLGVDAAWPGDGPLRNRVRQYLDDSDVVVTRTGSE